MDDAQKPTQNYHVLRQYKKYLKETDRVLLKVPQVIFAQKFWRSGQYVENPDFLNADRFNRQFYEPVQALLGDRIAGLVFEQEYQRKQDRMPVDRFAQMLDQFFSWIPADGRYHVELRTESYLAKPFFEILKRHGIGQVLSHWTWLPSLRRQFSMSGSQFFNRGKQAVVRLMTPRNVKYEDAYKKTFPFNKMVDGLLSPHMVDDTVSLTHTAIAEDIHMNIAINNRAGGSAPIIAQRIAEKFLADSAEE
jgi:hypothetical protein